MIYQYLIKIIPDLHKYVRFVERDFEFVSLKKYIYQVQLW